MFQGQKQRAITRLSEVGLETYIVIHQFILQDSVLTQVSSKKMANHVKKRDRGVKVNTVNRHVKYCVMICNIRLL